MTMLSTAQPLTDKRTYACLWLALTLAATGRVVVANEAGLAFLLVVFWGVFNGLGLLYASAQRVPEVTAQTRQISDALAVVGLGVFLLQLLTGGGIVQALLTLVLWALAAKNPALRQRRDAHFVLLGSLAVMMWAAGKSYEGAFVLLLVAYALAMLMALALLHQQKAHESTTGVLSAASVSSAPGYSWGHLLLFSLGVLLLALIWYLLVPRPAAIHYGSIADTGGHDYRNEKWWDEAQTPRDGFAGEQDAATTLEAEAALEGQQGSGSSGEMDGDQSGTSQPSGANDEEYVPAEVTLDERRRNEDSLANPLVMIVEADRPLYLRQKAFDIFDNDRWQQSRTHWEKRRLDRDGLLTLRRANPAPGRFEEVKYSVRLVRGLGSQALPLSADGKELRFPGSVLALGPDTTVFAPRPLGKRTQYSAVAYLRGNDGRPVIASRQVPDERYRQLPDSFTPEMRQLAAMAAGAGDRALAIEHYLRRHYAYSLEKVIASQGVTPMQDFLFTIRQGHCEYFATAMALMLRAQGIPSRVVHGYSASNYNPVTGYYEVHRFNGHAWVEGFIPEVGWMTFEPTPAYPLPVRVEQKNVALEDLAQYSRQIAEQQRRLGIHDWKQAAAAVFERLTAYWHGLGGRVDKMLEAAMVRLQAHQWYLAGLGLLLIAVSLLCYRLRLAIWFLLGSLSLALALGRAPLATRAIQWLSRLGAAGGWARHSSETVDEYLERISGLHVLLREPAERLCGLANRSSYAPADAHRLTAEERASVRKGFQVLGQALCAAAGQSHRDHGGTRDRAEQ